MANEGRKNRIETVDILRALGIILMLMGHVGFGGKFDRYIHSFHMPVFFVISGFLYKTKSEITVPIMIAKKAKRLLIPYVFYALVNYAFWFILPGEKTPWYRPLIEFSTYNTEHHSATGGAIWFLTALFWAEVVYLLIDRVLKNEWLRIGAMLIISCSFAVLQSYLHLRLPLAFGSGMVCLFFYESGRIIKDHGLPIIEKIKNMNVVIRVVITVVLFGANAVLAFVNPYVNVKSGWYGIIPLFFVNALLGSFVLYMIADFIRRIGFVKNYFLFTGSVTMVFLGLNQLVITAIFEILKTLGVNQNIVINIGILAVVMLLLSLISFCVKKPKNGLLNVLFGV